MKISNFTGSCDLPSSGLMSLSIVALFCFVFSWSITNWFMFSTHTTFWVGQQTNWPISFVLLYQNKRRRTVTHWHLLSSRNSIQNSWKWVTWTKKDEFHRSTQVMATIHNSTNGNRQQIKQSDFVTLYNQKTKSVAVCWFQLGWTLKNMRNSNANGPL